MAQSATGGKPVRDVGALRRLLTRPELAAVAGSILVFAFFAVVAGGYGFLTTAGGGSYPQGGGGLGLVAGPLALLMIAGEFDLSVGSMVGAAGMIIAVSVSEYGLPLLVGVLLAFAVALVVGFLNGYLVIKTGLPSFIVTLGMLFALRGLTIGFARLLTGRTQIGLSDSGSGVMQTLFAGSIGDFPVSIIWWFVLAALGTYVLQRTVFGNWIFGAGGDANAARNVGVPVSRVKITLFMCTAASAALLATIQVLDAASADVLRGTLLELQAIAAAVIGGAVQAAGYGVRHGERLAGALLGRGRGG